MKLLFVTDNLHGQHAFIRLWVEAFVRCGYDVSVVCLEDRTDLSGPTLGGAQEDLGFEIFSMGKERGYGKVRQALRFARLVATLPYDRVFIHMAPIWAVLGAWYWVPRRTPVYLWYTHYTMHLGIRMVHRYGKRLFCATPQSLPQLEGSPKKIVTGHGIDLSYWPPRPNVAEDSSRLLCVHRLSRSKRVELLLQAMAQLPVRYTLEIYGNEPDGGVYADELRAMVADLGLEERVTFHGSAPAKELAEIYANHTLILNMATETIDKTMLEAMTCGCYPVVTPPNAEAIGLTEAPEETPDSIARFVEEYAARPPFSPEALYEVVSRRHGLEQMVSKLDRYIRPGV